METGHTKAAVFVCIFYGVLGDWEACH